MRRYRKASVTLFTGISLTMLVSPLMTHETQASAVPAASPWTVYTVAHNGNTDNYLVSINGKTGAMESSIPFVATSPRNLFVSPDRSNAYVLSKDPYITVLYLTENAPPSQIQFEDTPRAMAIAPDGKTAYVTVGQNVLSADLFSNQTQKIASFASPPYGIAVSPDGKTLYVATASTADNHTTTTKLVAIDIASETLSTPIQLETSDYGNPPVSVNLSPDGSTAYVYASKLEIVNLQTGAVKSVDMAMSGYGPGPNIVLDPRDKVLYALNSAENLVSFLNLKSDHVGQVFASGDDQQGVTVGMAVPPDGSRLYVSAYSIGFSNLGTPEGGKLDGGIQVFPSSVADSSNPGFPQYWLGSIPHGPDIAPLPHGGYAGILAVTPDQAPHASFTVTRAPVGQATVFDASASYGDSPIKIYHWNFGDGTTSDSSVPVVTHTYHKAGNYTVTLTDTDAVGATVDNRVVFDGQHVEVNAGSPTAETSHSVQIVNEMMMSGIVPFGVAGRPYHAQLKVLGGTAPYRWDIVSGLLPPGLTLNSKTGLISGTQKWAGYWHVTISAIGAHGVVISPTYTISILPKEFRLLSVNGHTSLMTVEIRKDPVHKDMTTYIWRNTIEEALGAFGIQTSWDGKKLSLITPNTSTVTGSIAGTHPYSIWINGLQVEAFPNVVDYWDNTLLPLYNVMEALKHVQGLKMTWDGSTLSIAG